MPAFLPSNVVSHGNYYGNQKICALIGKIISQKYGISNTWDSQYEATRVIYDQICTSNTIFEVNDTKKLLRMINKPGYTVMFSVNGEVPQFSDVETKELLRQLGLMKLSNGEIIKECAYIAVVEKGKIIELIGEAPGESLSLTGAIRQMRDDYLITSVCNNDSGDHKCSITINGKEYSINKPGLNIVVYDSALQTVVDSVCVDSNASSNVIR